MNTKILKGEEWKDVVGLEKYFQVSNLGRVKSKPRRYKLFGSIDTLKSESILQPRVVRNYLYVMLEIKSDTFVYRRNMSVHRLVAINFIPNPENKAQVNHIDGNKMNNSVSNLEWNTVSENHIHAFRTGLRTRPKGNRKYTYKKIEKIRELRLMGYLQKDISKRVKVPLSTVTHILLNTRRKTD